MLVLPERRLAIGRPGPYAVAQIGRQLIRAWLLAGFLNLAGNALADTASREQQIVDITSKMNAAILRVQQIVNQPVTELRRTPDMQVARYPFWFHPGAAEPNFNKVDVRQTQEFPYSRFEYVTSDANPGAVFPGSELEFNSMTKYFYTNRSLPKKKLSEAEMLEINQLYRVIGLYKLQLANLEISSRDESQPAAIQRWIFTHKLIAGGAVVALLVLLILLRRMRAPGSAN